LQRRDKEKIKLIAMPNCQQGWAGYASLEMNIRNRQKWDRATWFS